MSTPREPFWTFTQRQPPRRWLVILVVAWSLILAGGLAWGLARPTPTDREQTTVADARPYVDEAIARVAVAVSAQPDAVVAVSGLVAVGGCDVSVVRDGERYRRILDAVVPAGTEADVLRRVADQLPSNYEATIRAGDPPWLRADAGLWVRLSGTVSGPGQLQFIADTGEAAAGHGCRARGDLNLVDPPVAVPAQVAPELLARLGLTAQTTSTASVSCVDGGSVGTEETRAPVSPEALSPTAPEGAVMVADEPTLLAYRTAQAQVVVRAQNDATIITVTTVCAR